MSTGENQIVFYLSRDEVSKKARRTGPQSQNDFGI